MSKKYILVLQHIILPHVTEYYRNKGSVGLISNPLHHIYGYINPVFFLNLGKSWMNELVDVIYMKKTSTFGSSKLDIFLLILTTEAIILSQS